MAYKRHRASKKKQGINWKWFSMIAVLVLLVLTAALVFWQKQDSKDSSTTVTPKPTTDKGSTPVSNSSSSTAPSTEKPPTGTGSTNGTDTPAPPANNAPLIKPYGSFVSNHQPGQHGSPLEEASVCNTSPGASCTITFTKGGVTKSLTAKTADSSGAVYWQSWTPQSVGLTAGNWTVTAVATAGQQTQSTQDPTPLEVLP